MEWIRKAGNLYCEGVNTWLALSSYRLPAPTVRKETFSPGGGRMDLEVPLGAIEPLVLAFNLIGGDPRVLGMFGVDLSASRLYTIYEVMANERTGERRERILTMRGLLGTAEPDEMSGRGLRGYAYTISSITDFEDVIQGYGIVARFNFWTGTWQGYGATLGDDAERTILRIAG